MLSNDFKLHTDEQKSVLPEVVLTNNNDKTRPGYRTADSIKQSVQMTEISPREESLGVTGSTAVAIGNTFTSANIPWSNMPYKKCT